jgi:RNA polymerase sigma factor (sigma-70 family)
MNPGDDRESMFAHLLDRNKRRLVSIARSYATGDEYQDPYQEMLLQIWRSLDRFEGRSSADTWVYRIALNTALTYRRQTGARVRHAATADGAPPPYPPAVVAAGLAGVNLKNLAYLAVTLVVAARIYTINRRAVRQTLQPIRDRLATILEQLAGDESAGMKPRET